MAMKVVCLILAVSMWSSTWASVFVKSWFCTWLGTVDSSIGPNRPLNRADVGARCRAVVVRRAAVMLTVGSANKRWFATTNVRAWNRFVVNKQPYMM
eukprot:6280794-Amphidinium_carterae.3